MWDHPFKSNLEKVERKIMVLFKTLVLGAAKRLASDPAARERALRLAEKSRPAIEKAMQEAKAIHQNEDPAFELGRLASRLKRKYLDEDGA
jgi:hypothetical protein